VFSGLPDQRHRPIEWLVLRYGAGMKRPLAARRSARKAAGPKASKAKRVNSTKAMCGKQGLASSFRKQLKRRTAELAEARAQQTATSELLKVIGRSKFDLKEIFESLAENGVRLCHAQRSFIFRFDGEHLRVAATYNASAEIIAFVEQNPIVPGKTSATARAAFYRRTVHVLDAQTDPEHTYGGRQVDPFRTILTVPMLKADELLGVILIYRHEVRAFTDREIALLETFANQAVIAIENVRLFEEVQAKTRDLQEALTSQTGSAKILKVIASSPTDVGPVLNAIVESACELCEAHDAVLRLRDGENLCVSAHHGPIPTVRQRWPINPNWTAGRSVLERKPIHVCDMLSPEGDEFPEGRKPGATRGLRSILSVPLLREGEPIGAITLRRTEVHPFSDKQMNLLQTFADQAVIALQNVRSFEEVQERTRELTQSLEALRTAQDRLIQTEKLAWLGQITAGIAHEIKNPLNFVNNFSALSTELIDEMKETLADAGLSEKKREVLDELTQTLKSNLEKVVQHGKRADSIVKNMLLHSREGSGEHRPVDINAIVEDSLNLAYHGARAEKSGFTITLRQNLDPRAGAVELYPQEITRALLNLISNGFYAATRRKVETGDDTFEPVLSASTSNLGKTVEIRIRDNGTGILPEVREMMFNPFFTTKPTGEGTGLGLSMTHEIIVKQHGGRIDVDTEPGVFTEFIITLPRDNGIAIRPKSE
jgi:two-component system, NtrC family, sensor kinase